jgi:hypothetical protein
MTENEPCMIRKALNQYKSKYLMILWFLYKQKSRIYVMKIYSANISVTDFNLMFWNLSQSTRNIWMDLTVKYKMES